MALISGIGGMFFRAAEPETLSAWYETHFGITAGAQPWQQEGGPTVFAPFRQESDYFPADKAWMLNFRTDDIATLMQNLTKAGIAVETRAEWDGEWGRFARVYDPEGNPIELWQPPSKA